ncbi:hypothetical protein [Paenibacillus sp.]|uniref:hypothetical protein n=1 Tax=Paenibacillus sp. TaxID=58172 RepID=UPI002D2C659E|nr:hypothetical protein [Paenibacillus sp.]HZG83429.1 hypothetical protein [Paenibacillus sp.]
MDVWLTFGCACALAVVHFLAKWERLNSWMERSWLLSGAGGVAVAYVFVHILPELSHHQSKLEKSDLPWLKFLENDAYLASMAGLLLYYGMERAAKGNRSGKGGFARLSGARIFWIHTGSFALYNALIGYLLVHRLQQKDEWNLALFSFAMALHFFVNDHVLHEHHRDQYDAYGRWLLAVAVLSGWGLGRLLDLPEFVVSLLFAFLSGALLVNVMKEELPHQERSNVGAFFLGAALYTVLLYISDR